MHSIYKKYEELEPWLKFDFGISKRLLFAIILTETYGINWMCRYEAGYPHLYKVKYFAKKNYCKLSTMVKIQKTSWGLMQVMGANYYYHGGTGWCTEMTSPLIGIDYGCKVLRPILDKYDNPSDQYAAYNRGSVVKNIDGSYVNKKNVDRFDRFYKYAYFIKE